MANPLSTHASALERALGSIEQPFLDAGIRLQSIHAQTTDLAQQGFGAMETLGASADVGLLGDIRSEAMAPVAQLSRIAGSAESTLGPIREIAASLTVLTDRNSQLRSMARRLHAINVYTSVESSRTDETKHAFAAFIEQMAALVQQIQSLSARMQRGIGSATDVNDAARSELISASGRASALREEATATAGVVAREVGDLMSAALSAVDCIVEYLNGVTLQVGAIVVALQVHDSMRQQVEHVIAALRQATSPEATATLVQVQAAQLAHSAEMTAKAYGEIAKAFDAIGAETLSVADSLAVTDSLLARLSARVKALVAFLESVRQQEAHVSSGILTVTSQARESSLGLSAHMEEMGALNDDLALLALNAIVSSERMAGSGKTLLVLATETLGVSRRSTGEVQEIMAELSRVELAAGAIAWVEPGSEEGCGSTSRLDQLTKDVAQLADWASTIRSRVRGVQETIRDAYRQLEFIPAFVKQLRHELEGLTRLAGSHTGRAAWEPSGYTMESERAVHIGVLQGGPASAPSDAPPDPEGSGEFGENVELF